MAKFKIMQALYSVAMSFLDSFNLKQFLTFFYFFGNSQHCRFEEYKLFIL